jgi:hypothetical protein
MSTRHRWEDIDGFRWMRGDPERSRCIKCGMRRTKQYDEENIYELNSRRWSRFAPPCPPPPEDNA